MTEVKNSQEAVLIAKNYLEKIRGMTLFGFNLNEVVIDSDRKLWIVKCEFYPNAFISVLASYEIEIDKVTGDVSSVKRVK
ncbi:MAG TPA: hypothetical protein VI933_04515 [archaeon]|nr:hypothetical protein [archaeon]